jgi:hypothetical protein
MQHSFRVGLLLATLAMTAVVLSAESAAAQDLHDSRRPSPVGIAKTFVGEAYIKVTYGRPYMRGREVFGAPADGGTYLVPFGELWRTGANEATEITVTRPVLIAGKHLEAGTYSIFTVPGASNWTVRFNKGLGMDGTGRIDAETGEFTPSYEEGDDVLVIEAPTGSLAEDRDQFTITFESTEGGAEMVLSWELTEVRIPIRP